MSAADAAEDAPTMMETQDDNAQEQQTAVAVEDESAVVDDAADDAAADVDEAPAAAAADAGAGSIADLMAEDGVDETLEEPFDDADGAVDADAVDAAALGAEGLGAEGEDDDEEEEDGGSGGGVDIASADPELVATLRGHLKFILANLDATKIDSLKVKTIMRQLKKAAGKKVIKQNKQLAKALARVAAQERLEEVQSSLVEGEEDAGEAPAEEEEISRPPIGDEEDDDEEEEEQPKKSRKRLRKAGSDDDDDGDYSEKRAPKKKKDDKKKKTTTGDAISIPPPKTAFVIFQQSERPRMREEHPDANASEVMKLISENWAALDADSKGEYEQIARKQKAAYRDALLRLKADDPDAYAAHLRASKKSEEDLLRDPSASKKKKKSSSGASDEYDEYGHVLDVADQPPKELDYFDSIVSDLKSRRQTKSELSVEDQKAVAQAFIQRMDKAAEADIKSSTKNEPGFARLKMLSDVQTQVSKPRVAEQLMDEGLLRVLNKWIAPESDGALANVRLRTVVYSLLASLNITEESLTNSRGLGKRIMRLWKDPEETLENKRRLEALIQKWMRPMLGLSTDFTKLSELDEERGREILARKALLDAEQKQVNYNPKRTMLPQAARFDYAIRPQANRDHDDEAEEARDASKAKRLEPESRKEILRKKMDKMKRSTNNGAKPRFKVDITGRASNI